MTGRVYLDWNASAPLRPEAREAMMRAMDVVGNASSVHGEGRKVKAILEHARGQVAEATGALAGDVVFTSGATEGAALALADQGFAGSAIEHDCVAAWIDPVLGVDTNGQVVVEEPGRTAVQAANSETGIIQKLPEGLGFVDAVQAVGKVPFAFDWSQAERGLVSAHKLGGPKGIGALLLKSGVDVSARIRGGGQESGRRAGTENIVGIAGFGAACEAATAQVNDGVWEAVAEIRDLFEDAVTSVADDAIIVGRGGPRLPNTSCVIMSGWKGETQVMQMDLAGFAVSAGSACSSGKVRTSRVLEALGYSGTEASSAIRVSIGPDTSREDVLKFSDAWTRHYLRRRQRAA